MKQKWCAKKKDRKNTEQKTKRKICVYLSKNLQHYTKGE